jgi:peptidoglycan/LPS O-acetylase OafA/YrhL
MIKYRPEIDGLRAIAVLGVFFFHLDWEPAKGGWLGVDVFFVLSGYLISSLLLKELWTKGSISISDFYLRRARRIMPALLTCLICTFPIGMLFSHTFFFDQYNQSSLAALVSGANIFFWLHSGYNAVGSEFVPLLHTWTLGVEEQFYIFIPMVFLLMSVLDSSRRKLVWLSIFGLTVASFLLCRYGTLVDQDFKFYMLPTRMWELALGSFTALATLSWPAIRSNKWVNEIGSATGLALILFFLYQFGFHYTFAEKSLFMCLTTVFFIITVNETTTAGRLLSLAPVRFIGKISYSLYLWHWPLIVWRNVEVFKGTIQPSPALNLAILLAATAAATLSWKFIETPFRKKRSWRGCLKPLLPMAGTVAALAMIGLTLMGNDASTIRLNTFGKYADSSYDDTVRGIYPRLGPADQEPKFILMGDSHGNAVAPALLQLADEYGIAGIGATRGATYPLPGLRRDNRMDAPPYVLEWFKYVRKHDIRHILMVAKWNRLYKTDTLAYTDNKPVTEDNLRNDLRAVVNEFIREGRQIWIMDQVPQFTKDPILIVRVLDDQYSEEYSPEKIRNFLADTFTDPETAGVHILNPVPLLLDGNRLRPIRNNLFMYRDPNHVSVDGALAIKDVFRPFFQSML